jgi:hypothetical protein
MNKKFYYYSFAFFFAFGFVYGILNGDFNSRKPAALEVPMSSNGVLITPVNQNSYGYNPYNTQASQPMIKCRSTVSEQDRANATNAIAQIDMIHAQALAKEAQFTQISSAYDAAYMQNINGRASVVNANPNMFMWPGNPYDNQYSHLLQARTAISRDREFNLTYSGMQILLIYRQHICSMTAEQKNDAVAKYMQLTNSISLSSTSGLYSYPPSNDPYLLAVPQGSMLGVQTVAAVPAYDPSVTGMYAPATPSAGPDQSTTGVIYKYDDQGHLLGPVVQ